MGQEISPLTSSHSLDRKGAAMNKCLILFYSYNLKQTALIVYGILNCSDLLINSCNFSVEIETRYN